MDGVIVRRLIALAGGEARAPYIGPGKPGLLDKLGGYNSAAQHSCWAVLVDLDRDCDCAPPCRARWLPLPSPMMSFHIAVRAVEAWLLADRQRMADLLRVRLSRIPSAPETLDDPKRELVDIARHSRSPKIRKEIVPRVGSHAAVGPLYTSTMLRFVQDAEAGWRPEVAAENAASLARCITRLRALVQAHAASRRDSGR